MSPIVWRTIYGETIFVSDPVMAARAMITWATAQGHEFCKLEEMNNGCVRVNIPGLTFITLAPKGITVL